jgi:group I intron endonuclease
MDNNITRRSSIYKIRHIQSGKVYIGSAVNTYNRWMVHLNHLRKNKHHSIHLQRAWNRYGEQNFKFEIIEKVKDKNNLIKREQYWMDHFDSYNPKYGYNISPTAGSQLGFHHSAETIMNHVLRHTGFHHTKEARKKISEAGHRPCKLETRKKISLAQKGKPRPLSASLKMRGRKFTKAHRLKLSLAKKGKTSPNKGKKFTKEWRENLSKSHIGLKYKRDRSSK